MSHATSGRWANTLRAFARASLLVAALGATPVSAATFPLRWHWSNPNPHGNDILDFAYHNGVYVEITDRGQVYTSDDLSFWIPRDTHVTNTLQAATFFGDRLVVTGENGLVLYADTFDNIQAVDLGTSDWLEGVAASTNLVVAVGDNAALYTSTDGAVWQRQPQSAFTSWLRGVAYGNGLFVTVGEGGFIATSSDGTNWQQTASGTTSNLNTVRWVTNGFWAVGEGGTTLFSASGSAWQTVPTGAANPLYAVAVSNAATVVDGDAEVRLRSGGLWFDELNPSLTPTPAPSWTYFSALWDGTSFWLGGDGGLLVQGIPTNTFPAWQTPTNAVRNWLWDVTRMPDFYVAAGDHGTVMTSDNGLDWTLELLPDAATNSILLGVGGTTNLLVAAGSAGTILYSPNVQRAIVTTNADGTTITTNTGSAFGVLWYSVNPVGTNNDLQGVAALGNLIVVTGGNGTILTSTNATNWTRRTAFGSTASYFLSSVAAYPGGLVAVGDNGTIVTSPTGTNWTLRFSQGSLTTNWIYRVRYLGGQLVAVGQNGLVATSTNGTIWTLRSSGTSHWLNDAAYIDNTYFAVGNQGTVLASGDGITWTNIGTITEKSLYGLAVNGGQLLAVGVEGVILRSQVIPLTTPVNFVEFSRASGQNLFLFSGQADQRFTLDSSVDLTNWITGPVLEFYDSSGALLYLQNSNAAPLQFRRTTLSP